VNRNNQITLNDDRVGSLLLKLSLPAFIGMSVITLYNVVDTIFIGHFVGPLGIAGLSIVFPIQMLAMGIAHMVGMGGASLISRLIGANDIPRAERALGNVITCAIALSAALMITGLADANFWLRLMGATETILPYARDYMTIILIGMFFQIIAMSLNDVIRSEGNARIPMIGMIMGAVLNIVLDAIFIIPLGMGIKGAALATVIAQLIAALYLMRYYLTGSSFIKMHPKNLSIDFKIVKDIFAIGAAAFGRTLTGSLSAIIVNRLIVAYGGDFAISAFGIIGRIMMFAIMPGMVIGLGLQPVLGYNYGAEQYKRALKAIKIAMIASTICSAMAFIALYFFPEVFIHIFTADSELIALGSHVAKRIFFVIYLMGFVMVGSTIFQSIGKATQAFITSVARSALFLIPAIFILPNYFQLDGIWLAFPIADVCTFVMTMALLVPQITAFVRMSKTEQTSTAASPA
jgi:putative MATE family efflux protein